MKTDALKTAYNALSTSLQDAEEIIALMKLGAEADVFLGDGNPRLHFGYIETGKKRCLFTRGGCMQDMRIGDQSMHIQQKAAEAIPGLIGALINHRAYRAQEVQATADTLSDYLTSLDTDEST